MTALAEAHASMGVIRMWFEWDWKEAEREFLRAIELKPGQALPHMQYNLLLVQSGRLVEAEEQIRAALAAIRFPCLTTCISPACFIIAATTIGHWNKVRRALDLDPNDIEAHVVMGLNYEQKRMYPEAVAELEKARELSGNNPLILGPLGSCYAGSGDKAQARKLLDELNAAAQQAYVAPITWVMLYLGLGEMDAAFAWLEKAAEARDPLLYYLKVGPIYDSIRDDPRCAALLNRIGLGKGDIDSNVRTVTQHESSSAGARP